MLRTKKQVPVICPSTGQRWTVYLLEKNTKEEIKISQVLWEGKSIKNAAIIVEQWLKGNI